MEFVGLQTLGLINLAIILVAPATSSLAAAAAAAANNTLAKANCTDRCGNVIIPFPFGTTESCYLTDDFFVNCSRTFNPPKPFLGDALEITNISLYGQLKILYYIAQDCYSPQNRTRVYNSEPWIKFTTTTFTVNNTANKFTVVGCDTMGSVSGQRLKDRDYKTGCTAMCDAKDDVEEGSCAGLGCCQTSFPKHVRRVDLTLKSDKHYKYVSDFDSCGYAFVVEETAFKFSAENLTNLKNVDVLPMVIDWAIGNGTCEEAEKNSSAYACKSVNSKCDKPINGYGYRCYCEQGYQGNPYLVDGCRDIDECHDEKLNDCKSSHYCHNIPGSYKCSCPKGYHGDGKRNGQGCTLNEFPVLKLVAGISIGIIALLLSACWLYMLLQRRRLIKMRQHFFRQNGGILLQEKLRGSEGSPNIAEIFSESDLKKATNDFHNSMIVGQGGYGTVYKGVLPDNSVAIKKAKEVPKRIDQFTNESEFVSNGTLFEHIHNKAKARFLSWDTRLRIATETAGVLSYLHFAASIPIIHRDVKSSNILLDHTFTAKVSDFGASRLFPLDQTELTTLVQGTFGYLDPEYMQTSQLTEKSDVYSFGVVLVELLTGRKAVSHDRPEEERSLANFFLYVMKEEELLFQVLEENVVREGNKEVVMKVADLAKRCLNVKGDERPCMKEVEMELEGLRHGATKHSSIQRENDAENMEFMSSDGFDNSFSSFGDPSTSIGFDSIKDH